MSADAGVRPGECHVWTARAVSVSPDLAALLDDAERRVYASFLREPDAALYVTAHALLRLVVGEALGRDPADLVFAAGPHGKPYLENARVEFSLSHAGERVAVAVTSDTPVGVDVERVPRAGAELPLHVLSPAERAAYDLLPAGCRAGAFTSYWVRKEAVLKATGEGLRVDPARLTVSAADRPAELLGWRGRKAVRGEAVQGKAVRGEAVQPHLPVRLYDLGSPEGYR
ncbi:4'-phosphopantetheinyl transferase family protein [Streptomyces roseicoloratus]|uniref:4'-phosphopantetheinyl transferase family protein n=1 Tax=Streptomyces roseicoloratus TaxID=2508722 RepID=UPI001009FCD1|nr:4'-phosphopantetheinyl transferase superfamily protein [Streptomyces roseicoloratus]